MLFKQYTEQTRKEADPRCVDRLVAQPRLLTDTDRTIAEKSIAWPASRVVDGDATVGVLVPEAPEDLKVLVRRRGSRTRSLRSERLDIDLLAKPNLYLARRGIPTQSFADRYVMCSRLIRIARLFERLHIVYADWSYSNAFWHPVDHRVYLIDLDTCSYGPRKHVETSGFEDPLTPLGLDVDTYLDRYRAALLVSRCLTGERDVDVVRWTLATLDGPAPDMLLRILTAAAREDRPSLTDLATSFDQTTGPFAEPPTVPTTERAHTGSGVSGWRPRTGTTIRVDRTARHRARYPSNAPANHRKTGSAAVPPTPPVSGAAMSAISALIAVAIAVTVSLYLIL
jgi:hypothetical protein